MTRQIASIIVMAATDDGVSAVECVPDQALADLLSALTVMWKSVAVDREPPPIWMWEPLVAAGVIPLADLVAIVELRMDDSPAEKLALREILRSWMRTLPFDVRIRIVWPDYQLTYVTETLDPGVAEETERYGCEAQVA